MRKAEVKQYSRAIFFERAGPFRGLLVRMRVLGPFSTAAAAPEPLEVTHVASQSAPGIVS